MWRLRPSSTFPTASLTEPTEPTVRPARRRPRAAGGLRAAGVILVVVLIAALVVAAILYMARREVARRVLVGWLDERGIIADVEVERIELDGFTGRIRIGDPANPDFQVERVEVDYAIGLPWSSTGFGVTPSRVRLIKPILRVSWIDGKLSLGSLDPLVEEFTSKPPKPDSTSPLILVEQGRARLTTEYGPVDAFADARIDNGKLMRLALRVPEAALKSGDVTARIEGAALDVTTVGDRSTVRLGAAVPLLDTTALDARDADILLTGELPYPDLKTRRGDGAVSLALGVDAASLSAGEASARGADLSAVFNGTTEGWLEAFSIEGALDLDLKASGLTTPGLQATTAVVTTPKAALRISRAGLEDPVGWRVEGPALLTAASGVAGDARVNGLTLRSNQMVAGGKGAAWEATGPVNLDAGRLAYNDIALNGVTGALQADVMDDGGLSVLLDGRLRATRGAWPILGTPSAEDAPELRAMKAAMGAFALDVPRFRLAATPGGLQVDLPSAVTVRPNNGGVLTLTSTPGRPVFSAEAGRLGGGGGLTLVARRGEGLPEARVQIASWRQSSNGFSADLDLDAALDFDVARGITLKGQGVLASAGPVTTFSTSQCLAVAVERLELDENDAEALSGALCPSGKPILTLRDGGWRAEGRLDGVAATVPFLAMAFTDITGPMVATGSDAGLGLEIGVEGASVSDTTDPARFHPLAATGRAGLADEVWSGNFTLSRGAYDLATVTLNHSGPAEAGGVAFDTGVLNFAPNGLQPELVTPLADVAVKSPVTGEASFAGRFDWAPEGVSSGGTLTIPRLDFVSPVGPVTGLTGQVEFTSLTPLITAPGQRLTAETIEAFAPLSDVELVFALNAAEAVVTAADLKAGGGKISIEPFTLPLDPKQPFSGVLVLERVQLGEIVEASSFADKVMMDALVSGRLPFTSDAENGIRIAGGLLYAVQPGRLSILREALTGLAAGGGGEEVPPNVVQDLAYQAMEHLAFDVLDAEVNSVDGGRLGVVFHIKGRHQPPTPQELRLTLQELISREFLNRELPLPSGTEINLTLDTTLNVNELLADFLALQRARAGEADPEDSIP